MSSIPRFQIGKLIFSKMIGPLIDLVIDQSESEEWETSDLEDLIFFFFFFLWECQLWGTSRQLQW